MNCNVQTTLFVINVQLKLSWPRIRLNKFADNYFISTSCVHIIQYLWTITGISLSSQINWNLLYYNNYILYKYNYKYFNYNSHRYLPPIHIRLIRNYICWVWLASYLSCRAKLKVRYSKPLTLYGTREVLNWLKPILF